MAVARVSAGGLSAVRVGGAAKASVYSVNKLHNFGGAGVRNSVFKLHAVSVERCFCVNAPLHRICVPTTNMLPFAHQPGMCFKHMLGYNLG